MDFKKRGKTIVFVTHDLSSVIKYCDRVMVLNEGKQIDIGSARDMVDLYKKILVDQETKSEDKETGKELLEKGKLKSNIPLSENIIDYGTKQAEIIEVNLLDQEGKPCERIEKFKTIDIRFTVHFNEEIHDPIFALSFKDIKGTEITGWMALLPSRGTNMKSPLSKRFYSRAGIISFPWGVPGLVLMGILSSIIVFMILLISM